MEILPEMRDANSPLIFSDQDIENGKTKALIEAEEDGRESQGEAAGRTFGQKRENRFSE